MALLATPLSVACAALAAVILQGCGDHGKGSGGAGQTTITTTTSFPGPPRTPPLSIDGAVKYLNGLYNAFDEKDDSTRLGATITMTSQPDSFYKNIFCSKIMNPLGDTGCYKGGADCRLSASLYGHKWIVNKTTNKTLLGLGRGVGYALNQTMVQTRWAKCTYIWDGASENKYNQGCGRGAPGDDCNKKTKTSAFYNICPSTGKMCTAKAKEVKLALCKKYGGDHPVPTTHDGQTQCMYPGAALDYHDAKASAPWKGEPSTDKMRDMCKDRVKYNSGADKEGPNLEKWNEIVLDLLLFLPDMQRDPAMAVPAFVYTQKGGDAAKKAAESARDEYCKYNKVAPIPLVMVDNVHVCPNGPFVAPGAWGCSGGVCTPQGKDPWASGDLVDCCEHLAIKYHDGYQTCESSASFEEVVNV